MGGWGLAGDWEAQGAVPVGGPGQAAGTPALQAVTAALICCEHATPLSLSLDGTRFMSAQKSFP